MKNPNSPHYSELEAELLRSAALDVAPAGMHDRLDAAILAGAVAAGAASAVATSVATSAMTQTGAVAPATAAGAGYLATGAVKAGATAVMLKWALVVAVGAALSVGVLTRSVPHDAAPRPSPPATPIQTPSPRNQTSTSTPTATPAPTATATPTAIAAATATQASSASVPPSDDLPAELQRIDEARAALTAGDSSRVIERIDRYDLDFPSPPLAAEALALRVEAYALRRDRERVRALAQTFLTRYPQHPLAARVALLRDAR